MSIVVCHAGHSAQHIPLHAHRAVPVRHFHQFAAFVITECCFPAVTVTHLCGQIVEIICHRGHIAFFIRDPCEVPVAVVGIAPLFLHGIDLPNHAASLIVLIDGLTSRLSRLRYAFSDAVIHGIVSKRCNLFQRILDFDQIAAGIVSICRYIAAGIRHGLNLPVCRIGKVQFFSCRIRDLRYLSQRIAGIGCRIPQRIGYFRDLSFAVVSIGGDIARRIRGTDQIARRRIGICGHAAAGICLCQHPSHTVIGKREAVVRGIRHL